MAAALRFATWVLTQAWRWGYTRVRRIANWVYNNWGWVSARIAEGWTYYQIAEYIIRHFVG